MTSTAELARIEDPAFYQDDIDNTYRELREQAPVYFYEPLKMWVLSKYEDVKRASTDMEFFTSTRGAFINDARFGGNSADAFFANSDVISYIDGERHSALRKAIAPIFGPRKIAAREGRIGEYCDSILGGLPVGEEFDFVSRVSVPLPIWAVADLCGMPYDNMAQIKEWSDQLELLGAPIDADEMAKASKAVLEVSEHVQACIEAKRNNPGDDLITTLLKLEGTIPMETLNSITTAVFLGGNETTRAMMSSAVYALALHPEQFALAKDRPELIPALVEEALRWASPVNGFMRTVVKDVDMRGTTMRAGDRVLLFYPGANRDDEVFENPETFDISRPRSAANLAFGYGPHFCPGQGLARLEGTVLLGKFVRKYSHVELTGEPTRVWSMLRNGFDTLPVKLTV